MQIPDMPFKVLALAPFCSAHDAAWAKDPIPVDKADLDQVMAGLGLSVYIPLPNDLSPSGGIDIRITGIKDFHPDRMVQNNDQLKNLMDARAFLKKAKSQGLSVSEINAEIQNRPGLPPLVPETERPTPKKSSAGASDGSSGSAIDNILDMVALPEEMSGNAPDGQGSASPGRQHTLLKQIETVLDKILNHIFSDRTFTTLESAWRGARLLLQQASTGHNVTLEIIPVSADTLEDTLNTLTLHLVQDLPSLILVDLPFNNTPAGSHLLEKIAGFAEILMVPAICWITKEFLYLDDWKDFNKLPFLPNHLDEAHYAKWHKLEQSTAGRWCSVTCNRLPSRYPYGENNKPRQVDFSESTLPWVSPVWGAAGLISRSFGQTGWPTRFTDIRNIYLEDLPLNTQEPDKPLATETLFTNDRIDQFRRIGIMPLAGIKNKDIVVMPTETTVAGISLQHQLLLSRITQFIFWCIDNLGKTGDPADIESNFTKAFSLFWQKGGFQLPDDMTITAGTPDAENKIPLRIAFTPQPGILSGAQEIDLTLKV